MNGNLRNLRKKLGFSLLELAAAAGVSTATLVAAERYSRLPGPAVRGRISTALGVTEDRIWPGMGEG